jgi:hypothetical protein
MVSEHMHMFFSVAAGLCIFARNSLPCQYSFACIAGKAMSDVHLLKVLVGGDSVGKMAFEGCHSSLLNACAASAGENRTYSSLPGNAPTVSAVGK